MHPFAAYAQNKPLLIMGIVRRVSYFRTIELAMAESNLNLCLLLSFMNVQVLPIHQFYQVIVFPMVTLTFLATGLLT